MIIYICNDNNDVIYVCNDIRGEEGDLKRGLVREGGGGGQGQGCVQGQGPGQARDRVRNRGRGVVDAGALFRFGRQRRWGKEEVDMQGEVDGDGRREKMGDGQRGR
jgi:hypothetical protein